MSNPATDYIAEFTDFPGVEFASSALVIIDMQYATGARDGALGRRFLGSAEGRAKLSYRFDRIDSHVVPNARRLLADFRDKGGKVIHVCIGAQRPDAADAPVHMRKLFRELGNHVGSPEHAFIPSLAPRDGEPVVRKTTNGAFASSGIDSLLRALGVAHLYLSGVSTNMCVETTGREAADRGYAVTLVEDACGATDPELHRSTMVNFQRLFGRVMSTAEVIAEHAGKEVQNA